MFLWYLNQGSYDSGHSLKGLCVEEFDDEMLETFKGKYIIASNEKRHEYSRVLLSLSFDSAPYANTQNQEVTKQSFENLINWLQSIKGKDQFSDLVISLFIKEIQKQKMD